MMESMQQPMTRAEFERRFHLLRERLKEGKMYFADRKMTLGIQKVRFLPNGRIDFLSVNESARLKANMMAQYDREDFKKMVESHVGQCSQEDSVPGYPEEILAD
ncbi:MAG: hypothetical protein PHN92_10215 [Geobacter sp.]|nr:hypothetical protein [Geobacter sp.]